MWSWRPTEGGMLVMIWPRLPLVPSNPDSGDPLWVRDLFRASRVLARNTSAMTRGATSTKLIL